MRKKYRPLLIDFIAIVISVVIAVALSRTGFFGALISHFPHPILGSFISGIFFTSIFTTAPAVALILSLADLTPLLPLALAGGAGAVFGDLIIFYFIRDRFSEDLMVLVREKKYGERFRHLLTFRIARTLTFLVGGLVIASPLPDELGISLLGFSKMRTLPFVLISFIANATGIFVIGLLAQTH